MVGAHECRSRRSVGPPFRKDRRAEAFDRFYPGHHRFAVSRSNLRRNAASE
jgi:hypothetical protein